MFEALKRFYLVHIALIAAVIVVALSACASCFPSHTDERYPVTMNFSGVTEEAFNRQLDLVEHQYAGEVGALGYRIKFNRLWKDGTANSDTYVDEEKKEWVINSYGGLARVPGMTADGYLAVACHELGHHLGGAPLYTGEFWASTEGAADYFTTIRCLKEIGLSRVRIAKASLVLARTLARLNGEKMPRPNTPDKSKVTKTYESHPDAQCRLDTYLAGLRCPVSGPLSKFDPRVNSCHDYTTMIGVRPLCWYKP